LDISHRFNAVAILGRQANGKIELAVALKDGRRQVAVKGCLYYSVNIAGIESVAGRSFPVHPDIQIRLPKDTEDPEVFHPLDLGHFVLNFERDLLEGRQVRTDNLDGIGALDTRHALFDVGLYVLREVEGNADELPGEFRLQF